RIVKRQGRHLARLVRALHRGGPGRLPGMVIDFDVGVRNIAVWGWCHLPGQEIVAVVLTINGEVVGPARGPHATLGLETPLLPHLGPVTPRSPDAGWEVVLKRSRVPVGD